MFLPFKFEKEYFQNQLDKRGRFFKSDTLTISPDECANLAFDRDRSFIGERNKTNCSPAVRFDGRDSVFRERIAGVLAF